MALACRLPAAVAAAATAAARGRRLLLLCRAASSKAAGSKAASKTGDSEQNSYPVPSSFTFEPAAAEAPLFPDLLQPGRRAVLLAVDPDLGGAVAALSWRNPPADASLNGSTPGSSGSSTGAGAAAAQQQQQPQQQQQLCALLASPDLQVELHDMPLEVWRYGTRDKRQPEASGLVRIIRQYTDGGGAAVGWGAEGSRADGASGGAIGSVPVAPSKPRRKAVGKKAGAAAAVEAEAAGAEASIAAAVADPPSSSSARAADDDAPLVRAVVEYSMPAAMSGKYAWHGVGFSVGLLNGLLTAAGVPFHRVHATTWKGQLALKKQGKEGSMALACHLLPAAAEQLKRKKDHGRAEALLIAAWALGARMQSVSVLRPIDLLKARVFESIPAAEQERWGAEWQRMEAELAQWKPVGDELLTDVTPILLGRFAKQDSALQDAAALCTTAGAAFIERVLQPFSRAFCELRSARVDRGVAPQRASYHLRSLGRFLGAGRSFTAELRPVALLLLALHSQQRLSDDRLVAGLEQLEAMALAATLCKWQPVKRRRRYLAALQGLGYGGAWLQAHAQPQGQPGEAALPEALQLTAAEQRALLGALDGRLYDRGSELCKAILLRLNEFSLQRSGGDCVQLEDGSTALAVDCVLPQAPADAWAEAFTKEAHAEWVGRAANLALLAGEAGGAASSQDFRAKKYAYLTHSTVGGHAIPLTDDVSSHERWTPAVLEARQRELLALAADCWRLH